MKKFKLRNMELSPFTIVNLMAFGGIKTKTKYEQKSTQSTQNFVQLIRKLAAKGVPATILKVF